MTLLNDHEADFAAFYREHLARVSRLVARRITDPAMRMEAVQLAFTRAATQLARGGSPHMLTLANHASTDVLRSHRRRLTNEVPCDPHDVVAVAAVDDADPEAAFIARERRGAVRQALDALEPTQRELLMHKLGYDVPYEEISARTGATDDALRSLVKRARVKFRQAYEAVADPRDLWGGAVAATRLRLRRFAEWAESRWDGRIAVVEAVSGCLVIIGCAAITVGPPPSWSSPAVARTAAADPAAYRTTGPTPPAAAAGPSTRVDRPQKKEPVAPSPHRAPAHEAGPPIGSSHPYDGENTHERPPSTGGSASAPSGMLDVNYNGLAYVPCFTLGHMQPPCGELGG